MLPGLRHRTNVPRSNESKEVLEQRFSRHSEAATKNVQLLSAQLIIPHNSHVLDSGRKTGCPRRWKAICNCTPVVEGASSPVTPLGHYSTTSTAQHSCTGLLVIHSWHAHRHGPHVHAREGSDPPRLPVTRSAHLEQHHYSRKCTKDKSSFSMWTLYERTWCHCTSEP